MSIGSAALLEEYKAQYATYAAFAAKLEALIRELLQSERIQFHSITSRAKALDSLAGKLQGKPGAYLSLESVTDLAGIRVITYFDADVVRVAHLIEKEFEVDAVNTVDKREALEDDRFGYISLHHVVSLNSSRRALREYSQYPALKAEIQSRSILQHAWAEIEHDLGYKTKSQVPRHIRRRFSRVAGLLELADQEFGAIRADLENYKARVPSEIRANPALVTIDKASLSYFVSSDEVVSNIDQTILQLTQRGVLVPHLLPELELLLSLVGIKTIEELKAALVRHETDIVAFAREWLVRDREAPTEPMFPRGLCLFYLVYVMVTEQLDELFVFNFLNSTNIGTREEHDVLAKELVAARLRIAHQRS